MYAFIRPFSFNGGTNIQLLVNALMEMTEECLTADVVIEDFITFDNELKMH